MIAQFSAPVKLWKRNCGENPVEEECQNLTFFMHFGERRYEKNENSVYHNYETP